MNDVFLYAPLVRIRRVYAFFVTWLLHGEMSNLPQGKSDLLLCELRSEGIQITCYPEGNECRHL